MTTRARWFGSPECDHRMAVPGRELVGLAEVSRVTDDGFPLVVQLAIDAEGHAHLSGDLGSRTIVRDRWGAA